MKQRWIAIVIVSFGAGATGAATVMAWRTDKAAPPINYGAHAVSTYDEFANQPNFKDTPAGINMRIADLQVRVEGLEARERLGK